MNVSNIDVGILLIYLVGIVLFGAAFARRSRSTEGFMAKNLKSVGKRTPRLNGPDIVTGRIHYADDVQLPGMLYGRILRSPHGHARILKVDVSKALALPGVVAVVMGRDDPF